MRIYLSLFRSVDPNRLLSRWKPTGLNPNKPNQSWPKWWQSARRAGPTVKESFWERYGDFVLHVLVSPRYSDLSSRFLWGADGSGICIKGLRLYFVPNAVSDWNELFSRCDSFAGIGNDLVMPISPCCERHRWMNQGARCATSCAHTWLTAPCYKSRRVSI